MANVVRPVCTVFENGTPVNMGRVTGNDGAVITQASLSTITYTIYLVDANDKNIRTVVDEHEDVSVAVASTVYDTLQTSDDRWTVDATGYNFLHQVDVSVNAACSLRGRTYHIVYEFTPASGQVFSCEFEARVI